MPAAGQPHSNAQKILWSLPQPILVFSSMLLVASALVYQWMDPDLLFILILVLRFPIAMLALGGAVMLAFFGATPCAVSEQNTG